MWFWHCHPYILLHLWKMFFIFVYNIAILLLCKIETTTCILHTYVHVCIPRFERFRCSCIIGGWSHSISSFPSLSHKFICTLEGQSLILVNVCLSLLCIYVVACIYVHTYKCISTYVHVHVCTSIVFPLLLSCIAKVFQTLLTCVVVI